MVYTRGITSERVQEPLGGAPLTWVATKPAVLLVEDEDDIRELMQYNLLKEGYQVIAVGSGEEALEVVGRRVPDLVVLDLMLPGMDGLNVCRRLRGNVRTQSLPILVVSARGEEADVVAGLNLGADDYLTKPFSPRVLVARTRAVLRRSAASENAIPMDAIPEHSFQVHDLVIHPGRHQAIFRDRTIDLTSTEFRVLAFLAAKPGWVYTRQQILDGVHGTNYAITDRAIDVQIVGLRKKLGEAGQYIETVRGVGYRFREGGQEHSP